MPKLSRSPIGWIPAALLLALWSPMANAQLLADDACAVTQADTQIAACGLDRTAAPVPVAELTPRQAWLLKRRHGESVLFIDVRSIRDAADGQPDGVDVLVPFREPGSRPGDSPGSSLHQSPRFIARIDSEVFARSGQRSMPVVLICRTGDLARLAAAALQSMGYLDVSIVLGGFDGGADRAGLAVPGWKQAGLPWRQASPVLHAALVTLVAH